ncbi:MAG: hypothetical protein L3K26_00400 [Candidatus Hydrogenedentes bacterium]|nr:hypothetical protein [Candidatus Hydrogenedentota bacterium]
MPTGKTALKKVVTLAESFVLSQKGHWGHEEWEKLLADVRKAGVKIDGDESKRNLGNILEGGRHFFESAEKSRKRAPKR